MIEYSLLLYTLIIQNKSWSCPYFEIGCAEICMHLEICAQRDLRSTSAPAYALFYDRTYWTIRVLFTSLKTQVALRNVTFFRSGSAECFIWFRVIHLNHKTVIVEVPLVTKYRNKCKVCFHWIATKTNSLLFYSSLLIISMWSTFQLWHYRWRDIHIVYNLLAATHYKIWHTRHVTLIYCFTLSEQTFMKVSQVVASVFLEGAAVLLAPPCHLSPSTGQSEDL